MLKSGGLHGNLHQIISFKKVYRDCSYWLMFMLLYFQLISEWELHGLRKECNISCNTPALTTAFEFFI